MKLHVFCFDLPQSDACFIKAYPAETTEAFLDGHVSAFAFFGGVPLSILYDNLKIAVARILGDGKRQRTRAFTELVSHYLFQGRFGRPGKGNDKGKVEALVKYSRANFLTPVPHATSFDVLNASLEDDCRARQAERAGRHEQTIGERLDADKAILRALPETPFEPCDKRPAKVSSTALVRYRMNDYSTPTAYGFRDVLVKGFVDEVVIICGASEIARHPRVYDRGQFVFDPKHYLALLEQKPGALDQAAPLQNWTLPEPLQHLRRLLEARMGKFDVTFANWDACVSVGGCPRVGDSNFGRGTRPVINVNWNDAQQYVAWLSKMTGEPYHLLTEAEWEYAARAGATTAYYWGDEIGVGNANCNGCGSQWDGRETAPVGSFKPNAFGLYDMAGNVVQWVQDCYHSRYYGAPTDGSAWTSGDCSARVVRGGSWNDDPRILRSANRYRYLSDFGDDTLGFRVERTLTP